MPEAARPRVYSIGAHRSFADALAAGLIAEHGKEPLGLARGRILLPNNRAVRSVTEAFVRASGGGLLLPRLIAIGDPELDDRIGGALDPVGGEPIPPAVQPLTRLIALARLVRRQVPDANAAESFRLAADLARTLDSLLVEEVSPTALKEAVDDAELARHWQISLDRLRAMVETWPGELAMLGRIDLADRRNRLLRATASRWAEAPPEGFTVAAGITTSAPAIAALLARVARMPGGAVILPALIPSRVMSGEEWDALGPDAEGRTDETHPQWHLKRLLDRIGVARDEVEEWRYGGRAAAPAVRGRAVAHAMAAARFTDKWNVLPPPERRLSGIRYAELPDPGAEAQAIAIALREVLETPGMTAALVTPDRLLASRVSALLQRWGIQADDSAGKPLSQAPIGTLLLGITTAAAERLAPVATLALVKHPLAGQAGDRRAWLDSARLLDLALRGPRPPEGLAGIDAHCAEKDKERKTRGCGEAWLKVRPALERVEQALRGPTTLSAFAASLREMVAGIAGDQAWSGADGRAAADLLAELESSVEAATLTVEPDDAAPMIRQLLDSVAVRPPYGGHPRLFIFGLLEARLQQMDLMILGGLNEGVWPAIPQPDPWLAPKIRANLGLPGLEYRIGLAAHDFASALGAPKVLVTRARRDGRSPTIASRFLLRLQAMTGGLARDIRLERLAVAIDTPPGKPKPVERPRPSPRASERPKRISVTAVDRLKADPFSFYAQAVLRLRSLEPVDADHTAAWKGSAVHKVLEEWLAEDDCDPELLLPRARKLLEGEAIHPMLRALWQPRLLEAIDWVASEVRQDRAAGRRPLAAEQKGETLLSGVTLEGRADRIDRLSDGRLGIIDYKTGKAPSSKAVDAGFALQLGLLGLIARAGGFQGLSGAPGAHEYWSLAKDRNSFGKRSRMDAKVGADDFLAQTERAFAEVAAKYLTGEEPFVAKLHPAFAPYGDYDQLMRLEEWYGRE
ncbi:double-strand break repair protein AddB [Sphingomonas arenae]|uniref:double-strand break repair protein AddB n=1 Tax=Sphingomonas arenae TaxID=2812555 RepID=UPI0019685119|nr:double-strand break repair protein AddB [Sphingomonas arenae]